MVRQGLESGVNTLDSPIDTTRLTVFLSDNFDQVPGEEWNAIFASAPSARLVAFQTNPATREVYQNLAEQTNRELETLLGHRVIERIYVALSDYAKPGHVYAATSQWDGDPRAFRYLFRDEAVYRQAADDLTAIATVSEEICIIVLGQELLDWDATSQLAGVAHELVHCHQHVTHPGGVSAFFASPVLWMDEGYAAWAGETFVGGTSTSKPWWDRYLDSRFGTNRDSYQLFNGSYDAIGFYSMLNRAGVDVWGSFVPWFGTLRANNVSNVNRYITMTSGGNTDAIASWTASATRNSDFGSPWNSENGPGIGNSTRSRNPTPQRVLGESTMRAEPGEQRYRLAQVQTPADSVSIITVAANGVGIYRWQYDGWEEQFLVNGSYEKSWCVGEDCVCEDGTSPVADMDVAPIQAGQNPDLHVAMWGAALGADATVSVATLEDECEEETEVPAGPLDACLFGTWNPDPQQFQDLILTFYRTVPGVSGLTLEGTIDLTFSEDGTFTHVYNGVQGSGTAQGQTIEGSWSGGTFGRWEAADGLLTLTFTGSDIVVTVGPATVPSPGIPTESVDAPYTCGPSAVEFDPPETPGNLWPLPQNWTKAG